jgi:hypothetical protein
VLASDSHALVLVVVGVGVGPEAAGARRGARVAVEGGRGVDDDRAVGEQGAGDLGVDVVPDLDVDVGVGAGDETAGAVDRLAVAAGVGEGGDLDVGAGEEGGARADLDLDVVLDVGEGVRGAEPEEPAALADRRDRALRVGRAVTAASTVTSE